MTLISLDMNIIKSQSSLCIQIIVTSVSQIGLMLRLLWVIAGHTSCVHSVVVLSCTGSNTLELKQLQASLQPVHTSLVQISNNFEHEIVNIWETR